VNYTYDSSSFLEFLGSIKVKSAAQVRDSSIFLFQYDILKVNKYQQIRNKYSFLSSQENIVGGDKDVDLKDREKKAFKIVDGENIAS
jgi:hypothetical protein